jgi:hypothetical protein
LLNSLNSLFIFFGLYTLRAIAFAFLTGGREYS